MSKFQLNHSTILSESENAPKGKSTMNFVSGFFFKDFYLFLERGEEREKERERNISVREKHQSVASCMCLTEDRSCNPGMRPEGKSNRLPFSLQNDVQPTEPHWSGLVSDIKKKQ